MDLQSKISILNLIKQNKDILFGKFSPTLTHADKIKKWKEIAKELNDLAIIEKDWKYLRDTIWQNWKRRTMEKRDNKFRTGSGGGKKMRFDTSDEIIISIIGKESPVVNGLDAPESSGTSALVATEILSADTENTESQDAFTHSPQTLQTPSTSSRKPALNKILQGEKILHLKKQKLEMEIGKLQRENYKLDLELFKLERELNITTPSNFTFPLYLQDSPVIRFVENDLNESADTVTDSHPEANDLSE